MSGIAFAAIALPVAPSNSPWWHMASSINGELKEMVGWPELVETVAGIYAGLRAEDKPATVILTGNYGEAGAVNLLGPAYGLPRAIRGVDTDWLRGYGDPPPHTAPILLDTPLEAIYNWLGLARIRHSFLSKWSQEEASHSRPLEGR